MIETLSLVLDLGFFAALIRISTPLMLATIGELYNERAGVLNLGIEGIMLLGAMVGFSAAYWSGSLWLGVVAALVTGALAGLLMSFLAVVLGVSQHVSGIGLTLLASGLAFYLYRLIFGQPASPPNIVPFQPTPIPLLSEIPVLGPVLFNHSPLTYLALLAVPVTAFLLNRTSWGLDLRTVGENPRAADAAGVSVWGMRTQALVIGGALMGMAGAYLTISQFNAFTFGVVSGADGSPSRWWCSGFGARGAAPPARCSSRRSKRSDCGCRRPMSSTCPTKCFWRCRSSSPSSRWRLVSRNARAPAALLIPFRKEER
jgi:simple sugar transport system permease protein